MRRKTVLALLFALATTARAAPPAEWMVARAGNAPRLLHDIFRLAPGEALVR